MCVLTAVIVWLKKVYATSSYGKTGSSMSEGEYVQRQVNQDFFSMAQAQTKSPTMCFVVHLLGHNSSVCCINSCYTDYVNLLYGLSATTQLETRQA